MNQVCTCLKLRFAFLPIISSALRFWYLEIAKFCSKICFDFSGRKRDFFICEERFGACCCVFTLNPWLPLLLAGFVAYSL